MRKITFNLYEMQEYNFINSSVFESFTTTTFLGITIDKDFLYNRFIDKFGMLNINSEMPQLWTNKLKRHLDIELVILNKKIEAFTNSMSNVSNFKQVESISKNYNYSKQPINLDVEGNTNYYDNATLSNNIVPTSNDFEAYNTMKNSYYNIIDEFIEDLEGGWFLCLL